MRLPFGPIGLIQYSQAKYVNIEPFRPFVVGTNDCDVMNSLEIQHIYFGKSSVSAATESTAAPPGLKARTACFFLFHGAVVRLAMSMAKKATRAVKNTNTTIKMRRFRFMNSVD